MDHSSYVYQYQYQYHRQLRPEEDQSQIQAYFQSTQSSSSTATKAYYNEQHQYQYYPHHYRPEHYLLHQAPSGRPPGVSVLQDLAHFGSLYYPSVDHLRQVNPGLDAQFSRSMLQPQTRQSPNKGGSSIGGKAFHGYVGGRSGHLLHAPEVSSSPFCGGKHKQVGGNEASQVPTALSRLPPRMSWCELCRVDCNTKEILEQHKNGKKHKKNLRMQEQLQIVAGKSNLQISNSDSKPRAIQADLVVASKEAENPPKTKTETSQAVSGSKINKTKPQEVTDLNCEVSLSESTLELEKKLKDHCGKRSHGVKRKKSGGRGGKHAKTNAGPKRLVDPAKPKEVIPFVCKLCNVRCESQVAFDSHLAGKKHLSKVKQYRGHQVLYGEVGLQALYPPDLSAASTSLISQIQQGISDPQAVLAQLLSYVLTQAPGLRGTQVPGLEVTSAAVTPPSMAMSTPVPCSTLDSLNQTNITRGSETGTADVTMRPENQPSSHKTEVEVAVTGSTDSNGNVAGTSASEVKNVTPTMGSLDVEGEPISSASVAENAVLAAEPTLDKMCNKI